MNHILFPILKQIYTLPSVHIPNYWFANFWVNQRSCRNNIFRRSINIPVYPESYAIRSTLPIKANEMTIRKLYKSGLKNVVLQIQVFTTVLLRASELFMKWL